MLPILLLTLLQSSSDAFKTQYHIQSDEGNIKFFKYSTYGGQYRKETRLDNGTVIGTFGWRDENGLVRYYDYLADEKGFRILDHRKQFDRSDDNSDVLDNVIEVAVTRKPTVMRLRKKRKLKARNLLRKAYGQALKRTKPDSFRGKKVLRKSDRSTLPLPLEKNDFFHGKQNRFQEIFNPEAKLNEHSLHSKTNRSKERGTLKTGKSRDPLPFSKDLLLVNQYPRKRKAAYLRLLGENTIITVPGPVIDAKPATEEDNIGSINEIDDGFEGSTKDASANKANTNVQQIIHAPTETDRNSNPSTVLLKKVKAAVLNNLSQPSTTSSSVASSASSSSSDPSPTISQSNFESLPSLPLLEDFRNKSIIAIDSSTVSTSSPGNVDESGTASVDQHLNTRRYKKVRRRKRI